VTILAPQEDAADSGPPVEIALDERTIHRHDANRRAIRGREPLPLQHRDAHHREEVRRHRVPTEIHVALSPESGNVIVAPYRVESVKARSAPPRRLEIPGSALKLRQRTATKP
jgi:hypothetical protein